MGCAMLFYFIFYFSSFIATGNSSDFKSELKESCKTFDLFISPFSVRDHNWMYSLHIRRGEISACLNGSDHQMRFSSILSKILSCAISNWARKNKREIAYKLKPNCMKSYEVIEI